MANLFFYAKKVSQREFCLREKVGNDFHPRV